MTLTLDQLRKLAELNMDEKHYGIYLSLIEPNIKSMLRDYLKGWQDLETLVTRIVLRAKRAYKSNTELIISDEDDHRKYGKYIDISIYQQVKKMKFGEKIAFLHEKMIIGDSLYQLLDFLRERRNKIHSLQRVFSEPEREAFSLANSIIGWMYAIISNSSLSNTQEKDKILQMCEIQYSELLSKLKEILSKPLNYKTISDDRPTIPVGKKDRYYVCKFCSNHVSVQFRKCPNCHTPNPDVQIL
jgi:hypothetical protein